MKLIPTYSLLGVAAIVAATPNSPALSLTLSEPGFAPLVIADGAALDAASSVAGSIAFVGSYGSYVFQSATGSGLGLIGSSTAPILGLGNTTVSVGLGASPLTVTLMDSGFAAGSYDFTSDINGTMAAHSVSFSTYADGTLLSTYTSPSGPFASGNLAAFHSAASDFVLKLEAIISQPFGGLTLFDANIVGTPSAVPPPSVPEAGSTGAMLALAVVALSRVKRLKQARH